VHTDRRDKCKLRVATLHITFRKSHCLRCLSMSTLVRLAVDCGRYRTHPLSHESILVGATHILAKFKRPSACTVQPEPASSHTNFGIANGKAEIYQSTWSRVLDTLDRHSQQPPAIHVCMIVGLFVRPDRSCGSPKATKDFPKFLLFSRREDTPLLAAHDDR
jgi:hypothetical protein